MHRYKSSIIKYFVNRFFSTPFCIMLCVRYSLTYWGIVIGLMTLWHSIHMRFTIQSGFHTIYSYSLIILVNILIGSSWRWEQARYPVKCKSIEALLELVAHWCNICFISYTSYKQVIVYNTVHIKHKSTDLSQLISQSSTTNSIHTD